MATRRELLLAATGGWLIGRVRASDGAGTVVEVEPLAALPGKKPLIRRSFRPPNFETPLADLAAPLTDDGAFFVRYHLTVIPRIDPDGWRLQVSGASARRALTLSLAELRSGFEQVEVVAVNQCAGNRRGLFTPRVPGVQWGGGAMGNARWRGVRLREVLQRAGVAADALEVVFGGADAPVLPATPAFVKSLPVERALDESTLVAFEMNGRPLPHWNGAPARLVVPGWVGTYWMKHLTSIRIEPRAFDGFWMKTAYRVPTGAFPGARFTSQETAETTPVTELLVNSLIVSPVSGARLSRGAHAELARLPALATAGLVLGGAGGWVGAAEPLVPAQLKEETVRLKDAPGRELTEGRCNICHSLDYIPSNAPAMNRAVWQKEVQKMRDRFGGPLTDEEARQILDYLDGNYSGKP